MDLSLGSVFWKHSNNFCLRSWRSLIFAGRAFTSVHMPHICHGFSPFTRVASLTLWNLHFTISKRKKKTTTTIAGSHQFISHLATAALSSLPAYPLYSLEFIFNAIAHLVFNLWRVFSLAASLCSNSIQDTVAVLHSCWSPHEGFCSSSILALQCKTCEKSKQPYHSQRKTWVSPHHKAL